MAVLCKENDGEFYLYRPASDKKFSFEDGEISSCSSHMHGVFAIKIEDCTLNRNKAIKI